MDIYPRILDIPLEDIELTLSRNSIVIDKDPYKLIKDLIFSGKLENASDSIINWILAYNTKQKYNIGVYNISQIIRASDDELSELSKELESMNKDDIIQILNYLNKLKDDLSLLPDDILIKIM